MLFRSGLVGRRVEEGQRGGRDARQRERGSVRWREKVRDRQERRLGGGVDGKTERKQRTGETKAKDEREERRRSKVTLRIQQRTSSVMGAPLRP